MPKTAAGHKTLRLLWRIVRYSLRHPWMILLLAVTTLFLGAMTGFLLFLLDFIFRVLAAYQGTGVAAALPTGDTAQWTAWLQSLAGSSVTDPPRQQMADMGRFLLWATPFAAGAAYGAWYSGQWLAYRCLVDLQNDFVEHLVGLDLGFHTDMAKGDLYSRMTADMNGIRTLQQALYGKTLQRPVEIVAGLVVLFMLNWQLALAVLGILVPLVVAVGHLFRRVRKRSRRARVSLASTLVALEQIATGVRVIKALGSADRERERYASANRRFFDDNMVVTKSRAMADAVSNGAAFLLSAVALSGGAVLFERNLVEPSQFIAFLATIGRIVSLLRTTQRAWGEVVENLPAAERIFAVMDRPSAIRSKPGAPPCPPPREAIRFEDVSFRYDPSSEPVLRHLDLEVPVGKTVALVGESGAGKSTIMDLIPRFFDVDEGAVTIDGVDVRDLDHASLVQHFAIVQQEPFLFNDTVYNNILYGNPAATREEVIEAAKRAHIHEAILALEGGRGYETVVGDRGERLSGGQRQRVAIARAFLKDAPVLLLDEPTSALDSDSERHVQEALEELMRGRTTIVVAHRLATIQRADIIYVLDKKSGRVVERGTHGELLDLGGEYARLVRLQRLDAPAVGGGP